MTTLARDGQRSIRAELNGSTVNASWRYRTYGDVVQYSGSATPSILGYAGQLLDPSGFYYMRARWYDAFDGRFMSADPAAADNTRPATHNRFGYAHDNPLSNADPTGYWCVSLTFGGLIAAGGESHGFAAQVSFGGTLCGGSGNPLTVGAILSAAGFGGANAQPGEPGNYARGAIASMGPQLSISGDAMSSSDLAATTGSESLNVGTPLASANFEHQWGTTADGRPIDVYGFGLPAPGISPGLGIAVVGFSDTMTLAADVWNPTDGWLLP